MAIKFNFFCCITKCISNLAAMGKIQKNIQSEAIGSN